MTNNFVLDPTPLARPLAALFHGLTASEFSNFLDLAATGPDAAEELVKIARHYFLFRCGFCEPTCRLEERIRSEVTRLICSEVLAVTYLAILESCASQVLQRARC
jgi:hypothetical protein